MESDTIWADSLMRLRWEALAHLRPPPRLRLSQWMESTLKLPDTVSAIPGPVRLFPYQREIADALTDPEVERVTLVKSVRLGFTTLLSGLIAHHAANDPAQVLALLPTEADCRRYVVDDLEPLFAASPKVAGLLAADTADGGGRNTLLARRYPGGSLKVVPGRAPRNLRSHNVRVLLVDEADGVEITSEGDPVALAERRTLSFPDRKIIVGSTPTFEATSVVLRKFGESDKRVFEVPCPRCGGFTEILWEHIRWPESQPEKAAFVCPHCDRTTEEARKADMVDAARWRATAPEVQGHAGFRLNALISPLANARWGLLAKEFIAAKRSGPDLLQPFVNTILAQGWKDDAEEMDESDLAARVEPFGLDAIPAEVLFITLGVDVQPDRLECTFLGWTAEGVPLVLGHSVIYGDVQHDDVWAELDDALKTMWPHAHGGTLHVDCALVDSGDGNTTERVMAFCKARRHLRAYSAKGDDGKRPPVQASKTRGTSLFIVGVDTIKAQLLARVASRSIRFSASLQSVWFEQFTAERRRTRYTHGRPVRYFDRVPGRRAEALDCVVYAIAARGLVQADPARRAEELASPAAPKPTAPPAVIRSAWMDRGR
ncbi:terminase gpA endonuclease subunit [Pararoseomonas sp. SCSIO 73927]|uniref:phage terminase large subunit family protein n=1 Tax=Pararoseomonas sp. SCSIO 73927 TaxID=3114537 RepID=UPI0030D4380B